MSKLYFWVVFGKRDIESLNIFLAYKLLFFSLINRTRIIHSVLFSFTTTTQDTKYSIHNKTKPITYLCSFCRWCSEHDPGDTYTRGFPRCSRKHLHTDGR